MKTAYKTSDTYSSQPNSYYNQSYTYSHYYQNKATNSHNKKLFTNQKPILNNYSYSTSKYPFNPKLENTNSKNIQNFHVPYTISNSTNITTKTNKNSKFKKNNTYKTSNCFQRDSNYTSNSCVTDYNTQTNPTLGKDSLLFSDVYSKTNNSNCSHDTYSNPNNINNNIDISNLLNIFSSKNSDSSNKKDSQGDNRSDTISESLDFETILKLKKIMERIQEKTNNNEPITNLLYAIKPFIQDSHKTLIDKIAKFISISSILQDFNELL